MMMTEDDDDDDNDDDEMVVKKVKKTRNWVTFQSSSNLTSGSGALEAARACSGI